MSVVYRREWTALARAYYSAVELDVLVQVRSTFFEIAHRDQTSTVTKDVLVQVLLEKGKAEEAEFLEVFRPMTVFRKIVDANVEAKG